MRPAKINKRILVLALAIGIPCATASTYVVSAHARVNAQLQELADNAALAGVNALVSNPGKPEHDRVAASIAAAQTVIAAKSGVAQSISPSVDGLTVSVVVDTAQGKRVKSTAYYIPARDGISPQQAASLSRVRL